MTETGRRYGYLTRSQHQMDSRDLVLRGGPLDGRTCAHVAAIGQRVFCGEGEWNAGEVYVVTAETTSSDGGERFVGVPAFAGTP